jgi:RNA polymerase sigma-70 factor (ECF subfamily)
MRGALRQLFAAGVVLMSDQGDANLVARCLEGDSNSFERLLETYEKPVFTIALRMTQNYEDAQDITQSVFVKAYQNLASFDARHKLFSWLYRIAVNESLNLLKKKRSFLRTVRQLLLDGQGQAQIDHHDEGVNARIRKALMRLKPELRAVVVLRHLSGCSYHDLSEILKIPEKTVKSRLFEARKVLRDILAGDLR